MGNIHVAPNKAPQFNTQDNAKSSGAAVIKKQRSRPNPFKGGGINRKLEAKKQNSA